MLIFMCVLLRYEILVLPEGFEPPTKPLWEAGSTVELQEQSLVGDDGFEPTQRTQQIYSLPQLSNSGDHP